MDWTDFEHHVPSSFVLNRLERATLRVTLAEGETAWEPSSTKRRAMTLFIVQLHRGRPLGDLRDVTAVLASSPAEALDRAQEIYGEDETVEAVQWTPRVSGKPSGVS